MTLLWNARLATGFPTIDHQHQELFRVYAELMAACETGMETGAIDRTLQHLERYTYEHFLAEEELMRHYEYPGLDAHTQQHAQLRDNITYLRNRLGHEGPTLALARLIRHMYGNWLVQHVAGVDRAYVPHITARQRAAPK